MTDIVERLSEMLACDPGCEGRCYDCPTSVASDAANEIERLREVVTKIASQSTSTPSKMIIEYARAAIVQSHMRSNND